MTTPRSRHLRPAALLLALLAGAPLSAQRLLVREVCDETTPLTLVGVDSDTGTALLALPSREPAVPGWLIRVTGPGHPAWLFPDPLRGRRFGGSTGPGPVLALEPCGAGCVRLVAWRGGRWERLGPPLDVPGDVTLHPTWDGGGRPWVLLHAVAATGATTVTAFRLDERDVWSARGVGPAHAVGSPGARPMPGRPDAVVAGTLRFSAHEPPAAWIAGLPAIDGAARGTLLPLADDRGVLLAADSRLFATADGGRTWREQLWAPWSQDASPPWRRGRDVWLDLPSGHDGPPLGLLWMDDRPREGPRLWLTSGLGAERTAIGPLARGAAEPPIEQALRAADGSWLLIAGCRRDERTASLLVRRVAGAEIGPWQALPLTAGW